MTAVLHPSEAVGQPLFTCLSCSIAFPSGEDQRTHYRSDHHRYNMKRRAAGLPPVSATMFNQKVLERRQETAIMASAKGSVCEVCKKTYTTENAYRSHINSKKHKENELKAAMQRPGSSAPDASEEKAGSETNSEEKRVEQEEKQEPQPKIEAATSKPALTIAADATEEQVVETIDQKIAAARSRLSTQDCLFCPSKSPSLEENLTHMSLVHSFFIPDAEYLVDLPGLIAYLGEKIAVGNVCLYCSAKSRDFRSLDAVRKHMLDKSHCKMAYDSVKDRMEYSDYYDFSSSYPDFEERERKRKERKQKDEEWEDIEDGDGEEEVDEVVEEEASSVPSSSSEVASDNDEDASEEEEVLGDQLTYGDTTYELVLPSGARIGHRAMRRYYAQSFPRTSLTERKGKELDPNSGVGLVRRLIADKNSALVPRKGGFGAYGSGTDIVKARNRGEAREAGRHIREFRDQQRKEHFKTRIGFRNNHQKHYRDPLLQ